MANILTPEYIAALQDRARQFADPINEYLLTEIARRISEAGQLTSTAAYEVWRAQSLGLSQQEIKKRLKELLDVSNSEIEQLLTQTAEVGYNFDISRHPTVEAIPFAENTVLQQIVSAAVELAQEDFSNIVQTIGFVDPGGKASPLTKAYKDACDFAFKQVSGGAADYNTAIRQATKNLADQGIVVISYDSNRTTTLEAAVRRNIMGGLGLMQEKIGQYTFDAFGCDGWEISAHANSAPDHEPYQGIQLGDEEYKRLNNSLVRRISTLNCGHISFPIILGVDIPQYTPKELEKFRQDNAEGVTVDGKHYSGYEATQMQRKIERAMRREKRRILTAEATGDTEGLSVAQTRLQRLRQEYTRFSDAAGLRTQDERAQVAGFGHKEAARARKAAAKQIAMIDSFKNTMSESGYIVKGFDYYSGDAETLNQMRTAFSRLAHDFPEVAKGMTLQLSKIKDKGVFGWFDPRTKSIHYNREVFKNWGEVGAEYAQMVQEGHFPKGTDAQGCFYHEFGHAVWSAQGGGSLRKVVDNTLKKMGHGYVNVAQRKTLLRNLLSGYATETTNPAYQEVIAEAFSEWYNSSEPREFCISLLKEAGLI